MKSSTPVVDLLSDPGKPLLFSEIPVIKECLMHKFRQRQITTVRFLPIYETPLTDPISLTTTSWDQSIWTEKLRSLFEGRLHLTW